MLTVIKVVVVVSPFAIALVLRWIWRDKSVQKEADQHAIGRSMLRAQRLNTLSHTGARATTEADQ